MVRVIMEFRVEGLRLPRRLVVTAAAAAAGAAAAHWHVLLH
jgi:hypothetical protein